MKPRGLAWGWGGQVPTMKKEAKLIKKLERLLKRLGHPRWLHHYGPRTYEFLEHLFALLVRAFCRLSYRRVKQLFDLLGIICPSKSALQATMRKLNAGFWRKVLQVTCGTSYLAAFDSTCFSRTNPSYHYLRRIDGKMPQVPIKASVAFDTRKKKFCAAKIRVLPAHDIRDAPFLLQQSRSRIAVADKAYSAEYLYALAHEQGTLLMIPQKVNIRRGFYRKKMQKLFRLRTYHRREMVEAGFGSSKRMYGSSVSSRSARTIRSEVYCRFACHNILSLYLWTLRTEPRVS